MRFELEQDHLGNLVARQHAGRVLRYVIGVPLLLWGAFMLYGAFSSFIIQIQDKGASGLPEALLGSFMMLLFTVFLLQGSGDADREAESFYADHFARSGIATLVYDKRGTGSSSGDHRQETFNDFAADALAGVHYLQSRKEIDRNRVGLYGRSHGGIVAPLAASLSRDVAFVINVSGAGVPPYQQMTYQAETEMRRDGFSEADIAEAIAYMNQKWEVARTGGKGWDKLQSATQSGVRFRGPLQTLVQRRLLGPEPLRRVRGVRQQ